MALKGHTRIELTNIETGEVEVHEDDNMVTNALSKLLGSYGCFCNNPLAEVVNGTPTDTVMKLTGGLMLFDTAIEENPEIINAPAGVSVVGCGSADAYNGANTMAGSYNMTESGWTEDGGYKHVWDFSTSQANGNIACASLTTNAGGKITEGTFPFSKDYFLKVGSNVANEILFMNGSIASRMEFYNTIKTTGYIMFADGINNRVLVPSTMEEVAYGYYTSTSSTAYENFKKTIFYKKSIDISFYRFGFTNVSIFDGKKEYTQEENNGVYLGSVTVEMPDGLKNIFTQELLDTPKYYWSANYLSDGENIYIVLRYKKSTTGNILPGESIYIWEINAETFESTYHAINNLSDENYDMYNLNTSFKNVNGNMLIGGDFLQFYGTTTKKIYLVNKYTNETTIVKTPDGEEFIPNSHSNGYFYNGKFIFHSAVAASSGATTGVVDTVTKHITFKNIIFSSFTDDRLEYTAGDRIKIKGTHYYMGYYSDAYICLCLDPTLLVTINNLETPVQKTSAQTMKVTYVLTQE